MSLENEAAQLIFDEKYPRDEAHFGDVYYPGGRIGEHKVVMGIQHKIGLSAATALVVKMSIGFPNVKYWFLVGIAGGMPQYGPAGDRYEMVLGDVVVSAPRGNHGGVIQYDWGAWVGEDGRHQFHGFTNGVPGKLLAAVNNLRAEGWSRVDVSEVLRQMRHKLGLKRHGQYDDPGSDCDRLYKDDYEHKGTEHDDCADCCDLIFSLSRRERGVRASRATDEPGIHFANIASSNQLQLSATKRKDILLNHDAICFEMEAAGVMEEHPCIVIRGICDYADSHKNKGWQHYAAATAAAYAKRLLEMIPRIDIHTSTQSGTTIQPVRVMPFLRDPDFVEREEILDQLKQKLSSPNSRVALVGLGGVG
jgi:nucleoside phosphorylase